ncbi:MAG: hypothetical protein BEN18_05460 [Epulopiscium sp. Nuni2H_MBin001]|nr:MAG: hypothetical protein BEN18_05460 [Epulopiscium sp. Nuni2H_MBin001]
MEFISKAIKCTQLQILFLYFVVMDILLVAGVLILEIYNIISQDGLTEMVEINFIQTSILAMISSGAIIMTIVVILLKNEFIKNFYNISSALHYTVWVVVAAGLILALESGISMAISPDIAGDIELKELGHILSPLIVYMVFISPILSECVFRYAIMSCKFLNQYVALVVSILLFVGVQSSGDFNQMLILLPAGIILGYTYLKTRNLWYTIGIHILYCMLGTILIGI